MILENPSRLDREAAIGLMSDYFRYVDGKDIESLMRILTEDCHFRIETDRLDHKGAQTGVRTMFERLFGRYSDIWHGNFSWVFDEPQQRIAAQLEVINTEPSGVKHYKYNSSFYHFRDGKIAFAGIYMSGTNALV